MSGTPLQEFSGFTARLVGSYSEASVAPFPECRVKVLSSQQGADGEVSTSGRAALVSVSGKDGTSVAQGNVLEGQYHFSGDKTAIVTLTQAPGDWKTMAAAHSTGAVQEGSEAVTVVLEASAADQAAALKHVLASSLLTVNLFDAKTDRASSDMYFHYYGMLQHQQNMLQDSTRTGTYFWAIMRNTEDFAGKVVVDVGAGSGILSLFAAQAGARKVYAVEASKMVAFASQLVASNGSVGARVEMVAGKIEEVELPEKADVLISEPMGTLLLNERMIETYIHARKRLLKPGGKLFPSTGRIFVAGFQDHTLHAELTQKALFWLNPSFYGVDLTVLHGAALEGYYNQVVVDAFDPGLLMSTWATHTVDFMTADEEDLHDVVIPLQLVCKGPCVVHGIACWFDVLFPGVTQPMWLSTAPGMATTHWFQLRCVLQTPLRIAADGMMLSGTMRMVAHARQSYHIHVELQAPALPGSSAPQVSTGVFDLKEPYYRQITPTWWTPAPTAEASLSEAGV